MQNVIFKKYQNTDSKNKKILFLFFRPTDLLFIYLFIYFFAVLSVDQKINVVSPKHNDYRAGFAFKLGV